MPRRRCHQAINSWHETVENAVGGLTTYEDSPKIPTMRGLSPGGPTRESR